MRILAALAIVTTGCSLYFDDSSSTAPPSPSKAEREWEQNALPILREQCAACHEESGPTGFLAGDAPEEIRATVLAYRPAIIDLGSPASSRLLTKGLHSGPTFTAQEVALLLEWIEAERDEAGVQPQPRASVGPFSPEMCSSGAPGDSTCPFNELDASSLGLPAGRIQLVATPAGSQLVLSRMLLVASSVPIPLHHPVFVAHPVDGPPVRDPDDQLAGVVLAAPGPIGTGVVTLRGAEFLNSPISLDFDSY